MKKGLPLSYILFGLFILIALIITIPLALLSLPRNERIQEQCDKLVTQKIKSLLLQFPDNEEYKRSSGDGFHIDDPLFTNLYLICLKEKGSTDQWVLQYLPDPYYSQIWFLPTQSSEPQK